MRGLKDVSRVRARARALVDGVRGRVGSAVGGDADLRELYLELMKQTLTNSIYGDAGHRAAGSTLVEFDADVRRRGRDWPVQAHTMVGLERLKTVQLAVEDVIRRGVPGDLIETGVWRGGVTIFMRAILKAYGETDRRVWVADSFRGLPPPDTERYPADKNDPHHTFDRLAISQEEVRQNFARYDLLDDQVQFLEGWFKDTLPSAPIASLAVMRLDGDMYESTMDGLVNLYPKLSVGGYVIVDDYGAVPACKTAIDDFRAQHGIRDRIEKSDWTGVYWRRTRA